MTDSEILKLAIEKAIKNGLVYINEDGDLYLTGIKDHLGIFETDWWMYKEAIIFSHDFAKAFWGEEDKYIEKYMEIMEGSISDYIYIEDWNKNPREDASDWLRYEPVYKWNNRGWQYHLQQMVLEENPLKYLEKFLSSKGDK